MLCVLIVPTHQAGLCIQALDMPERGNASEDSQVPET